ncbi:YhzE/YjcZ family sporulation protein YuzJ, partial [Bacillus spizizenii]
SSFALIVVLFILLIIVG